MTGEAAEGPTENDLRLAQGLAELAEAQLQLDGERLRRQDSEALFDRVFSAMADAFLLVDPRGEVSRANQAAVRLTALRLEDLVGKHPAEIFGPSVPASPWELFRRAPGGTLESIDAYVDRRGDGAQPVSVSCAAIQDTSGKVVGAVYAARDISLRKEAEEHREAQLRLTQILATSRTITEVICQLLEAIGEKFGWRLAAGWLAEPQGEMLRCEGVWRSGASAGDPLPSTAAPISFGDGRRAVAAACKTGRTTWSDEVARDPSSPWAHTGLAGGMYVPIASGGAVLGVIELLGAEAWPPKDSVVELLAGMGKQIGDFIERKHAQEALDKMELFQSAFDSAPVGMALFGVEGSARGRVLQVNKALCDFLCCRAEDILATGMEDLTHPDDLDAHLASIEALLSGEVQVSALETRYVRPDGDVVTGILHCSLLRDQTGRPLYGIGQLQDITERKRAEQELAHRALHDPLTGLPNRLLFMDRLAHALQQAKRRRTRAAVIFADLDNFKVINDSLGHGVGDDLLVAVAERLTRILRPADTVSRFGGDEFTILCEDIGDDGEIAAVAERIAAQMALPFSVQGRQVFLTLSLGIAPSGDGGEPAELLRDADAAMYSAKAAGRARHAIFDKAMRRRAVKRLELEHALRRAIEHEELRLVYQPQIELGSGEVFGFEALLRWHDPDRGVIPPLEFIPLAEETGLIIPIGEWVLEQACLQARSWRVAQPGATPLKVSVNLSVCQLADRALPGVVRRVLDETGVAANDLWLEITETALIEDQGTTFDALANLERLGVRLAIDDFGIGFSSLNRLRQLPPVEAIKIDKAFVDGIRVHSADRAIVAAAISLAAALEATTVAEGVETADQVLALRELGCDLAQGYHFSRPKPAEEFDQLMGPGRRRTVSAA